MTRAGAIERFLASPSLSEGTRRCVSRRPGASSPRGSASAGRRSSDVDARALADYAAELGARDRRQARSAGDDRAQARRRSARSCGTRSDRRACPTRRSRRAGRGGLPDAPVTRDIETLLDALEGDGPLALRNRALLELVYSAGLRSARSGRARPRRRRLRAGARARATARARRSASCRSARRRRTGSRRYLARRAARRSPAAPRTRSSCRRAGGGSTRAPCGGSARTPTGCATRSRRTCSRAAPTCARSRSCSATARSRPRRSTATSTEDDCAVSTTARIPAILSSTASSPCSRRGARRAPSTPTAATSSASRASSARRRRRATTEELERYLAQLRADGLAPRPSRDASPRCAAFFRHLHAARRARATTPLPSSRLPRRMRRLPRTLSPSEAERLIEAANGTTPARAARPRARRAPLRRGAPGQRGGRRSSAAASTSTSGSCACTRQGRQGADRAGRPPRRPRRSAATSRAAARYLERRQRPELFLNAKGGPLTRAGAFLILRRLAGEGGPRARARPPAPAAALLRDAPARGRRRPPERAGDARPRRPRDDRALHARLRPATPRGVLPGASARRREAFGGEPNRQGRPNRTERLSTLLLARPRRRPGVGV